MTSKSSSAPRKATKSEPARTRNPRQFGHNAAKKSPFAHIGSYMSEKNRKLREQFNAGASSSSLFAGVIGSERGIFSGISIFVDGFTVPSSQELRACMLKHGGRYENYFSRCTVTHIICSHLPDSKMRNFRAFSRGLPVVKPAWVVDSIAANKLLNWVPYQLDELENGTYKQQKLSSFFIPKSISSLKNTESDIAPLARFDSGSLLNKDDKMKYFLLDEEGECSKFREESMCLGKDKFCKMEDAEPKFGNMKNEQIVTELEAHGACINDTKLNESLDKLYVRSCNQQQDTLGAHNSLGDCTKGAKEHESHQLQLSTISCSRPEDLHISTCADDHPDIIPLSVSQLDFSVLHELPEELKVDILESLPPHRASNFPGNGPSNTGKKFPCDRKKNEDYENPKISLWMGTPPSWVEKFQCSDCLLLNVIAIQHSRSDRNGLLSLTLQSLNPFLSAFSGLSAVESDEVLSSLFELFKQYIELKVESDIEELYVCFRILRRFATDVKFLLQVYDLILPFLQASISEIYGGNFCLSIAKE